MGTEVKAKAALIFLHTQENYIERGLKGLTEAVEALAIIRDHNLYSSSHATFEEYVREQAAGDENLASYLIDAVSVTVAPTVEEYRRRAEAHKLHADELVRFMEERKAKRGEGASR